MNSGNPSLRLLMHFLEYILLQDRLLLGECFNEALQGTKVRNFQLTAINGDIFKDAEGYKEDQDIILANTTVMPLVSVAALVTHQIFY